MRIFTMLRKPRASLRKFYNFYKRNPTFILWLQKYEIIFKFSKTLKCQVWSNCVRRNYFANHSRPRDPKVTYLLSEYLSTIFAMSSHFCFQSTESCVRDVAFVILMFSSSHSNLHFGAKKRCKWNNAPCKIIMLRNRKDNITTTTFIRLSADACSNRKRPVMLLISFSSHGFYIA